MTAALNVANRYPDVDAEALRNTIALVHHVTSEEVVLGCGSSEILRAIDSQTQTNFVMVNTGRAAVEIVEHFRKNDVLVSRPFPTFDKHIRVSLGTPAEMREFWRVWDLMPGHKMAME